MKSVSFFVPGKPQGKARARTFYNPRTGKHNSITPDQTVLYENLIKTMYIRAAHGTRFSGELPVSLHIVAQFLPPKSTSKKKKEMMLSGQILPMKKPDLDNILKAVADALNGVAYHDDVQVLDMHITKIYGVQEGLEVIVEEYSTGE